MRCYAREMREKLGEDPLPLTLEKMQVYILWKQENGRTFATLANYICAFSNHFRQQNSDNLALSIPFKKFKCGLKRIMHGAKHPYQKEPFERDWFGP